MKNQTIRHTITSALICCACLGATTIAAAQGTRTYGNDNPSRRADRDTGERNRSTAQSRADAEKVRVTRASNYMGTDVIASDDRKVGDIVDYYFDVGSSPHLAYVVVMTGGFLDMGGDTRAVPASALTFTGDSCRLSLRSSQFWDVPVLPENRNRFLSDPMHRQRISQLFNQSESMQTTGTNRQPQRNQRSAAQTSTYQERTTDQERSTYQERTTGATDDPNRAGAMTGRASRQSGESRLVSYNELRNTDAYSQDGNRLGYFIDAWINMNDNRAPYVEITPTFEPFRTSLDRRYAVPTAKIGQKREYYGYNLRVTENELNDAEWVTETEGVKMLEEGTFGNDVLRVTVPEKK